LGGVSVTAILDEDDMASDSATALATQQSIKAYVDAQVGANNELSEILANGNTSGGTNIQMTTTDEVRFRDAALKINSSVDGQLDIAADVELEIVAPTLDINASTAVTIDTATFTVTGSANVVGDLDVDNLNLNGNAIISTNTNGNIALTPNGTGEVDISKVDIDGGTIDGTVIGGSTPAAISGTTISGTTGSFTASGAISGIFNRTVSSGPTLQIQVVGSNVGTLGSSTDGQGRLDIAAQTALLLRAGASQFVGFETDGSERTRIDSSGTLIHKLAATFNEDGADADFRVESDTNTHMLFVDAGVNALGINDSTPTALLQLGMSGSANITNNTQTKVTDFTAANRFGTTGLADNNEGVYFGMGVENGIPAGLGFMREAVGWNTQIRFYTNNITAGPDSTAAMQEKMRIESSAIVINENSYDQDFRVESDAQSHALFVDASTQFVGVNASSLTPVGASGGGLIIGPGSSNSDVELNIVASGAFSRINSTNASNWGFGGYQFFSQGSERWGLISAGGDHAIIRSSSNGSTFVENARFAPSGFTFNELGVDVDFRVESDTNTHALFVDAGDSAVGINNSDPGAGASGYTGLLRIGGRGMCYAAENNSVAASGTVDLTVHTGGGSFNGFLTVSNVLVLNASIRTQATYSIFGRGTDSFSAQLIATADGSSGGVSFTVTNPSTGVIRITNTSANTTSINAAFFGSLGF
jgi:cytoskeletal protein CcmA (bactofilin family)